MIKRTSFDDISAWCLRFAEIPDGRWVLVAPTPRCNSVMGTEPPLGAPLLVGCPGGRAATPSGEAHTTRRGARRLRSALFGCCGGSFRPPSPRARDSKRNGTPAWRAGRHTQRRGAAARGGAAGHSWAALAPVNGGAAPGTGHGAGSLPTMSIASGALLARRGCRGPAGCTLAAVARTAARAAGTQLAWRGPGDCCPRLRATAASTPHSTTLRPRGRVPRRTRRRPQRVQRRRCECWAQAGGRHAHEQRTRCRHAAPRATQRVADRVFPRRLQSSTRRWARRMRAHATAAGAAAQSGSTQPLPRGRCCPPAALSASPHGSCLVSQRCRQTHGAAAAAETALEAGRTRPAARPGHGRTQRQRTRGPCPLPASPCR